MRKTIITLILLFSVVITSCNSDPFASPKGSYNNVSWDISSAEEVTDKVAVYSLGSDAWEITNKSRKIVVKSDKLELKPVALIPDETRFEDYLKIRHDLGSKEITTVNTEDYINASQTFYKKAHLYEIKDEASQYFAPKFLVLDQSFMGRPVYRLPYNNSPELIEWDGHIYWRSYGFEQFFRADDTLIMYDDCSYPLQNAEQVTDEFIPIKPVQAIETVVKTVIDRHGSDAKINIYSAELYYVQGNEWIQRNGFEGVLWDEISYIPLWKYDYSVLDANGEPTDMGSVFIRPDNGQIADNYDQSIINKINSPG